MNEKTVYDLGEVSLTSEREHRTPSTYMEDLSRQASGPGRVRRLTLRDPKPRTFGWGITGSLSLFVPGAGQLVQREVTRGLFFICSLGFLAALGWAGITSMDRLVHTMDLFRLPRGMPFWILAAIYAAGASLAILALLDS